MAASGNTARSSSWMPPASPPHQPPQEDEPDRELVGVRGRNDDESQVLCAEKGETYSSEMFGASHSAGERLNLCGFVDCRREEENIGQGATSTKQQSTSMRQLHRWCARVEEQAFLSVTVEK
ncbi:unnamed protein product [Linum tenue]|uniref:Uncharacterized protein n=1 Tax=Linum tenue TaxID=586396 RepID=A0AAV0GYP2_9ROSI|nr:unnamed protein product [Linum tenue]